jgi:hypothetical protein
MASGALRLVEQATVQSWDNRPIPRHRWLIIVLQLHEESRSSAVDKMDPEVQLRKMDILLKTILLVEDSSFS